MKLKKELTKFSMTIVLFFILSSDVVAIDNSGLEGKLQVLDDRIDKIELLAKQDKISLGIEINSCLENLNYENVKLSPDSIDIFSYNYPSTNNFIQFLNNFVELKYEKVVNDGENYITKMTTEDIKEMLNNPKDFWGKVNANIVSEEDQIGIISEVDSTANSIDHAVGLKGASLSEIKAFIKFINKQNIVPSLDNYEPKSNLSLNTRISLNLKTNVMSSDDSSSKIQFHGKLSGFKGYRDINNNISNETYYNGNSSGNISYLSNSNNIIFEKAFIRYEKQIFLDKTTVVFSFGRKPNILKNSNYKNDEPQLKFNSSSEYGGYRFTQKGNLLEKVALSPITNWNFDGLSLGIIQKISEYDTLYHFKMYYGVGFDNVWDNSSSINIKPIMDNVPIIGCEHNFYYKHYTISLSYAHVSNISDGFKGLTKVPFFPIINSNDSTYDFIWNNKPQMINRIEPLTDIGNLDSFSIFLKNKYFFLSSSMSISNPEKISKIPFYNIWGQSLLSSDSKLEKEMGYNLYIGTIFPLFRGKFGIEYNWGSKNWFTPVLDDNSMIGNKLSTRGSVFESFYIQPVYKFFAKIGFEYIDYQYTGSGNPLGKPVKISQASALDTYNAVIDNIYRFDLSLIIKW